ncbi:hypothetical protein ABIB50_005410 [Mucilaginibacter sp. UYCu711]
MSARTSLLEIVDIKERKKSSYQRDRLSNFQGYCLNYSLKLYDVIYYPAQLKGIVTRPEVSFSFYKN